MSILKTLQDVMELGTKAQSMLGGARETFNEFVEAAAVIRPTLGDNDQASLDRRLEAVHAESMLMSKELDSAVKEQLLKARD